MVLVIKEINRKNKIKFSRIEYLDLKIVIVATMPQKK
jgi:hypothetical protein